MSLKNNFVKHLRILYYQSYLTKINNRKILIYPFPHKKKYFIPLNTKAEILLDSLHCHFITSLLSIYLITFYFKYEIHTMKYERQSNKSGGQQTQVAAKVTKLGTSSKDLPP